MNRYIALYRRRTIVVFLTFLLISGCVPVQPPICRQAPGVPVSRFDKCGNPSAEWLLSTVPSPNAMRFAITDRHAVWWDEAPAPLYNSLYFVDHGASCSVTPTLAKEVSESIATEAQDAVTNSRNSQESYVYFDNQGRVLQAALLPYNANFAPLSTANADQMSPGGSSDSTNGFAWQEDGDIWICPATQCENGNAIRVTYTSDREDHPRMHGDHLVWENKTAGDVIYAKGPDYIPIKIGQGAEPDVFGDWIVYAKQEPSPDPACQWTNHWQIWAYGPLSAHPSVQRISGVSYWGAANYTSPRLTDDYVVFLVDFFYGAKTVVGIYPVAAFGKSDVAMLEVDDLGDATGNVDAWQESLSVVHVLYRDRTTKEAKLRCCWP